MTATPSHSTAEEDAELMLRVQADERDAFGALFDRFGGRAYRLAYGLSRDPSRAEDIVQDAFLSVWRKRARFEPRRGAVAAWIMTIVRSSAMDALRRHRGRDAREVREPVGAEASAPGDLEARVEERDQAAHLRATLARLPADQRDVITLAYFGELSTTEIAKELSLPLGTVKGRMRLGLHKLRDTHTPDRGAQ